jgi:heparosan-N-sulfate-glucuronate 5-epimerase
MINRLRYWKRIFSTYFISGKSNLTFWHGNPQVNHLAQYDKLDQYYMTFYLKATYKGDYDETGIPKLNYQGDIGIQYNPIAVAQWSLGNYNLWKKDNCKNSYRKFIRGADWLHENLQTNKKNIYVWHHNFDWIYKENLKKPWYSGLAQGQGLSVLCRAYKTTKDNKYLESIKKVNESIQTNISDGGVTAKDIEGNIWIEEYIMKGNPTHILNGFIWALWGIYDYWLLTKNNDTKILFDNYIKTIKSNLHKYDIGYWSLYELSDNKIAMQASQFYHKLHIVQLKILFKMSNEIVFREISEKWLSYAQNDFYRIRSTIMKILFKIFYY